MPRPRRKIERDVTKDRIELQLADALAAKALAEARLGALGSVQVHWGWGQDENKHTYCCLFRGHSIRERSLVALADEILAVNRRKGA